MHKMVAALVLVASMLTLSRNGVAGPLPDNVAAFVQTLPKTHSSVFIEGLKYDSSGSPALVKGTKILDLFRSQAAKDAAFDNVWNAPVFVVGGSDDSSSSRYGIKEFAYYDDRFVNDPQGLDPDKMIELVLVAAFADHAGHANSTAVRSEQLKRIQQTIRYIFLFQGDGTLDSVNELTGVTGTGPKMHIVLKPIFGKNGSPPKPSHADAGATK